MTVITTTERLLPVAELTIAFMGIFEILGYVIALTIGGIMGLVGGGGSILGPMFIYLLGKKATIASAYTMGLVGITSVVGVVPRVSRKEIDFRTSIALGIPVVGGTSLVTYWLTHLIPDDAILFSIAAFHATKREVMLLLFASILLLSFFSLMGLIGKNLKPNPNFQNERPIAYYVILIVAGLTIGLITGFIGAGGGVMIVPLLVLVMGIPVKTVVGTSLVIMAAKSIIGFVGYMVRDTSSQIEWGFLSLFAAVMIVGILTGSHYAKRIPPDKLKTGFAWFILAMAIFILVNELVLVPRMLALE